jgi:DNA-binding NarL/FixJ family response regulator
VLIYLAEDHQLVAIGISTLLKKVEGVEDVKIFANGKELIQECNKKKPNFIFLDFEMPVMDGRETLLKCNEILPSVPCCMLTMMNEKAVVEECIQLGAKGFINKNCTFQELQEAIFTIQKGEVFYSNEILQYLSGIKKHVQNVQLKEPLSERELEVLKLLCDGFSPKEIADQLFLSPRTVDTHKNNIMQKFEVNTVSKLISVALKNKLV